MPIDLVIDEREGGSKSDSEEITRSSGPLDQVTWRRFAWTEVTPLARAYLHAIKAFRIASE